MKFVHLIVLLMSAVWLHAEAQAEMPYILMDVSPSTLPGVTLGAEYPGAQASVQYLPADAKTASPAAARLAYDFSKGGAYVQCIFAPSYIPTHITRLQIPVRASGAPLLLIRVVDADGETFQTHVACTGAGKWQILDLPVSADMSEWELHFGGDGYLHQPIKHLAIGVEKKDIIGTLDMQPPVVQTILRHAEVKAAALQSIRLAMRTVMPGNIFLASEKIGGELSIIGASPDLPAVTVMPVISDAWGKTVATLPPTTLSKANHFRAALALPHTLGCYTITLRRTDGSEPQQVRYAVLPANRTPDHDAASPFGVATHFNQGWGSDIAAILKRAGIAWMRDGEASLDDRAAGIAQQFRLCYLPCFTWHSVKPPLDDCRQPDGSYDFTAVIEQYRQYAKKYGAFVDAYDLTNEPASGWGNVLGGDWSGGPWLKVFMRFGQQVTSALKAEDPTATVLWEDTDILTWYKELYACGTAPSIDVISPHPYSLHRENPWPETQGMMMELPNFKRFVATRHLPWRIWSGEVGFSSYQLDPQHAPMFYSPNSELQQAQLLVRMMVGQLANGVERIFWYDMLNDGWGANNPEHNFGLIRNDLSPKPGLVAYANLIHQLGGGHGAWLGAKRIDEAGYAYAFQPANGAPVVTAWTRTGTCTATFTMRRQTGTVTVTDMFGTEKRIAITGGKIILQLSESPVYLGGLTRQEITGQFTK